MAGGFILSHPGKQAYLTALPEQGAVVSGQLDHQGVTAASRLSYPPTLSIPMTSLFFPVVTAGVADGNLTGCFFLQISSKI
jgi:hypothetical protein